MGCFFPFTITKNLSFTEKVIGCLNAVSSHKRRHSSMVPFLSKWSFWRRDRWFTFTWWHHLSFQLILKYLQTKYYNAAHCTCQALIDAAKNMIHSAHAKLFPHQIKESDSTCVCVFFYNIKVERIDVNCCCFLSRCSEFYNISNSENNTVMPGKTLFALQVNLLEI